MKISFLFVVLIIFSLTFNSIFFEQISAQKELSLHKQWKKFADLDSLTCNHEFILIQKNNGVPACVSPSTYLKLVDRGYGNYDSSLLKNNPQMMMKLRDHMISDNALMSHWHQMLNQNPTMMMQSMNDLIFHMKENPELIKNFMGPMTSDPQLRDKMITIMQNHPQMESHLKNNSEWMDKVHDQIMGSGMGSMMHDNCQWCPDYQMHSMQHSMMLSHSSPIMDMMHEMWIDSGMTSEMYKLMMQNPSHMAMMSHDMMEPMLNSMMGDEILRQKMIELMLEHQDFMNAIRHE